jgi:hypothetical protein
MLLGDWDQEALNARRGALGGYQAKRGIVTYRPGMPKLTPRYQKLLLADYAAGMKIAAIAYKYGVNESYPTMLARRRGQQQREHWVTRRAKALAAQNRKRK